MKDEEGVVEMGRDKEINKEELTSSDKVHKGRWVNLRYVAVSGKAQWNVDP